MAYQPSRFQTEGPATFLQSCTGCLKSVEILQSFSLEKVNLSVNYVISFVKRFCKLLRKFTAYLTREPQFCMILRHTYNIRLQSYNLRKFFKIVQSCTGFLGVAGPSFQTLQSIVPFQHSKHLYRYGIQVLHYQLLTPSVGTRFCLKLILEVREAKIDWLIDNICH